jgi:hypothetical protein
MDEPLSLVSVESPGGEMSDDCTFMTLHSEGYISYLHYHLHSEAVYRVVQD